MVIMFLFYFPIVSKFCTYFPSLKYGLIDWEKYCNAFYYTHTLHSNCLNAYTKIDIKSDQASVNDYGSFLLIKTSLTKDKVAVNDHRKKGLLIIVFTFTFSIFCFSGF